MANNKKPRKQYKPKARMVNTHEYVFDNRKLLSEYDPGYITNIQIRAHSALTVLIQGKALPVDMDVIAASYNIVLGLCRVVALPEPAHSSFNRVLRNAVSAIKDLCERGKTLGRLTARANELTALNDLIALHDQVLNIVTVKQFEAGMKIALADAKATYPKGKYHEVETNFQNT